MEDIEKRGLPKYFRNYVELMKEKTLSDYNEFITCATPVADPKGGDFDDELTVSLSTATEDATIYYTTDGSTPDETATEYTDEITISATTTLKAIAIKSGKENSAVMTEIYTIA